MGIWNAVGEGIWVRSYTFRTNPINTSIVSLGDGALMAISPGTDLQEADFAELDGLGTVQALVSPGAFHNMGLQSWKDRYPDAGLYGPQSAIAHIAKAHPALPALAPLTKLAALLPEGVTADDVGGMKKADLLLVVKRTDGTTWLTNEVLTNNPQWPPSFVFKMMFKLFGSGPGLNVNTLSLKLLGGAKADVRRHLEAKLKTDRPTRLVPCHGDVLYDPDLGDRLAELLERRL